MISALAAVWWTITWYRYFTPYMEIPGTVLDYRYPGTSTTWYGVLGTPYSILCYHYYYRHKYYYLVLRSTIRHQRTSKLVHDIGCNGHRPTSMNTCIWMHLPYGKWKVVRCFHRLSILYEHSHVIK